MAIMENYIEHGRWMKGEVKVCLGPWRGGDDVTSDWGKTLLWVYMVGETGQDGMVADGSGTDMLSRRWRGLILLANSYNLHNPNSRI